MTGSVQVTKAYASQYPDPIRVRCGDCLDLTGRTDNWNGHIWLWAVAADGREGWIPETLVDDPAGSQPRAKADYDARELDCAAGEILTARHTTHGWSWCENQRGGAGWVPEENLCPIS